MKNIFDVPEEDHKRIMQIVGRYMQTFPDIDKMSCAMDVTAVHSSICELDLDQLLSVELVWFLHDMVGIEKNLNRKDLVLMNGFKPKCMSLNAVIEYALQEDDDA